MGPQADRRLGLVAGRRGAATLVAPIEAVGENAQVEHRNNQSINDHKTSADIVESAGSVATVSLAANVHRAVVVGTPAQGLITSEEKAAVDVAGEANPAEIRRTVDPFRRVAP